MTTPLENLDDTVHQRVRLSLLAALHDVPHADFGYLRSALKLTDGNLSRHLQVLEQAHMVKVDKTYSGRRPRTVVSVTDAGRQAFSQELDALRQLVDRFTPGQQPQMGPGTITPDLATGA